MRILGIDPGGTTGYGMLILEDRILSPDPLHFGETKDPHLLEIEESFDIADLVVCEDFLLDPDHARSGTFDRKRLIASEVIGAVRLLCAQKNIELRMQPNSLKPLGYGYLGKPYKKGKKGMHKWDGLAHGCYYAVKHLRALPPGT